MTLDFTLIAALIIFVATYGLIISEKIHRTVLALFGAVLMILLGIINQELALESVDFNTLGLLIGMMVIVGIAKDSGMFQFVALWAARLAKGKPISIFLLLGFITALFSAFLDNVTTVLLMVPVTFVVCNNLKVNPMPFLIGTILLSNIGGTATLIGDPPNILIGSAAQIPFNDFLIHLGPVILIVTFVTLAMLYGIYRKELVATKEAQLSILSFNPKDAISDYPLLYRSLFVLALVLIGFFTHSMTHFEGATIALGGAALLLLLTLNDPEHHLRDVEWTTIFFFLGLFILVGGLEKVGVIHFLAEKLVEVTDGQQVPLTLSVLWGSAFFSAAIDNIPFVATMIPLIQSIGEFSPGVDVMPLWWALALGADIGGNATLVGASANVVVSGLAGKHGHRIGFFQYMKIAVPLTLVALLICTVYIYLRYLM
ncbi:ArsB/NhaD family transporter [Candidatus Peregrinibacteria bacterium]|nr:MAG: ArsB/NhaD family transporter [Candidatus Peregrinibacteria bacterium]